MPVETEARTSTAHGTLKVTWNESSVQDLIGGVHLEHISEELMRIGHITALASAIALEVKPDASAFERIRTLDPKVRRVHFGSPFIVELEIAREIAESMAALTFLIYAFKRAWGIDLELKAHREDMRRLFIEAKKKADTAQERIEQGKEGVMTQREAPHDLAEHELNWGKDAARMAEGFKKYWDGDSATLQIDDQ